MSELYEPKHLRFWTMPDSYFGAVWPGYYVFLGQHRDSDCLAQSNFACALDQLGGEDDDETVVVVREGHWAVGWVEWIAIHQDNEAALKIADDILDQLEAYPVLDEDDFSERETEEANAVWKNCYGPMERIEYIRRNRSQFEFHDYADMMNCIRGNYFAGYANELIG